MDISEIITNGGLVLSGGALLKISELALKAWTGKNQRNAVTIENQPVEIAKKPDAIFATKGELNVLERKVDSHIADNSRDHENLFSRLNRNDRETAESRALLEAIREQIDRVWNFLLQTKNKKG